MTTTKAAPRPRFLTTYEVAELLRKTVKFVRSEIEAGRLKAAYIGRTFLIKETDLDEYFEANYVKPSAQGRGEDHE